MPPKRKKSKPNPKDEHMNESSPHAQQQNEEARAMPERIDTSSTSNTTTPAKASPAPNRASWYGASWRSKASPVASIAKESISVSQGATSESSETSRPPSSVSKSMRGSRKSIPLAAEATRVHATSDAGDKSRPPFPSVEKPKPVESELKAEVVMEDAPLPPEQPVVDAMEEAAKAEGGGWFGWWSRPDDYGSDAEKKPKKLKLDAEEASRTPLPGTPVVEAVEYPIRKNAREFEGVGDGTGPATEPQQPETIQQQTYSRSWFGLWSTNQNQQATTEEQPTTKANPAAPEITISTDPSAVEDTPKSMDVETTNQEAKQDTTEQPTKSSGWAFWSTDKAKDPAPTPGGTQKQIGELAVADTPSQSNPEAAQFNEPPDTSKTVKSEPKRPDSLLKPKRGRPERTVKDSSGNESSSTAPSPPVVVSGASTPAVSQVPSPSRTPPPPMEASSILSRLPPTQASSKQPQTQTRPNLILPSFDSTFPAAPNPGYVERLTSYLAHSLSLPGSQQTPPPQHVYRSASPPKIKKAVALGIHGFFPGALIQKFLGQPRGTSVRLSNYAATAIKNWCHEHQPDTKDSVEVEKVALEGEGYIADRVATLWKLLLNWLSHLRQADFILVACHSQGVPVAIMLVAKLIQMGCLRSNVRVGVCAMAGINLGPFLEYRSRLWGGTALELFDFSDSGSKVSKAYADSLELCLRHGVRVTFAGSIDDQLVSLESSLHTPLSHPYVNRAVFIDGRIHAPNFLTHLVVFALKLRNLGVGDHGLIRELSAPLAGSIVGGEGHSRIYDEPEVYNLAIDFALESTDLPPSISIASASSPDRRASLPTSPAVADHLRRTALSSTAVTSPAPTGVIPVIAPYEPPLTSANTNPFVLPWAVRGLLEEDLVRRDMKSEVEELVTEFEDWRPTSKVLRDVRWRLEGVRGMV